MTLKDGERRKGGRKIVSSQFNSKKEIAIVGRLTSGAAAKKRRNWNLNKKGATKYFSLLQENGIFELKLLTQWWKIVGSFRCSPAVQLEEAFECQKKQKTYVNQKCGVTF